jgi:starch phosphorylase
MEDQQVPFAVALSATRAGNLFTTHTAVAAGFDRFAPDLMKKYLTHYAHQQLGIEIEDLLALGRQNPKDGSEPFNMAYLAVHGSGQVNGVSKLHGQVSRQIFQPLFPRWPQNEVPIGSLTNGVHVPTWDSEGADILWTETCGKTRWQGEEPDVSKVRQLTDRQLWNMRRQSRCTLIGLTRKRYVRQLAAQGERDSGAAGFFSETTLTLGFARRFATYKRPNLLLHDPDRLVRILSNAERPVQLILAGKAHPQDLPGQALVKQWNDFIQRPDVRSHVIFLSDYDMRLAEELVAGVDLWINTPRRPWEACGTSGMKILANGGLNFSELDGWWAEAYSPDIGWAIGDGKEHGEDPAWDAAEADKTYSLLEDEVVPMFYERSEHGVPVKWLARVRESMARLTPEFSASRAIRDYTESQYLPAALSYKTRKSDSSKIAESIVAWKRDIEQNWASVSFGQPASNTRDGQHSIRVEVFTGKLNPCSVRVELYATSQGVDIANLHPMQRDQTSGTSNGRSTYRATIPDIRPVADYTARIVPFHEFALQPLEAPQILWQR